VASLTGPHEWLGANLYEEAGSHGTEFVPWVCSETVLAVGRLRFSAAPESRHTMAHTASLTDRMIRAARLDANLYEEVEADQTATKQAMLVVVLSSVALGIGSFGEIGIAGLIGGAVFELAGWFVWAFLTYWIGTRLLPEPQTQADLGQLLRTTGFSASPGLLRVFGFFPLLWYVLGIVTGIWMLVAMVIAVRQALDYRGTMRAFGVCLIGWTIKMAFIFFLYMTTGGLKPEG